jgi:hypothetical protein
MIDGDNSYGAPISTQLTLVVGDYYTVSFYQASSEEDPNNKAYNDTWQVYLIPGTAGEYICPASVCGTAVDPGNISPVFTSDVMDNTGDMSTPWMLESFTFQATQTNEVLEFVTDAVAQTAGAFMPPLLALAAVTTTETTPEPGTWPLTLFGAGIVYLAIRRRRRSSRTYRRLAQR